MSRASLGLRLEKLAQDTGPGLPRLIELMMKDTGADAVVAFDLADTRDGPRIVGWQQEGRDPAMIAALDQWRTTTAADHWPDFARPSRRCLESFVHISADNALACVLDMPGFPTRVQHVLRYLVYEDRRFVGWIGALKCGRQPFTRRTVQRWKSNCERVAEIMLRDAWALPSDHPEQIIIDADGRILYATDDGYRWLRRGGAQSTLQATISGHCPEDPPAPVWVAGADVVFHTAHGPDGTAFMASIVPAPPVLQAPDFMLTPMQREVARYAAVGATVKEIANTLDAAVETIRTHLREVYRRLDVGSRVELAELLR